LPGPASSTCDAWAMLKVARHYYDRNIKTKKGEHNNNIAAGAMILTARYARIPNLFYIALPLSEHTSRH